MKNQEAGQFNNFQLLLKDWFILKHLKGFLSEDIYEEWFLQLESVVLLTFFIWVLVRLSFQYWLDLFHSLYSWLQNIDPQDQIILIQNLSNLPLDLLQALLTLQFLRIYQVTHLRNSNAMLYRKIEFPSVGWELLRFLKSKLMIVECLFPWYQ